MNEKVIVNIFGKEYTISGNESSEKIINVAAYVDGKMREIESATSGRLSMSHTAVLAAINIADDMFKLKEEQEEIIRTNEKLEGDTQHYIQLWDEAKKSFSEYKEDTTILRKRNDELRDKLTEKENEIEKLLNGRADIESKAMERADRKLQETVDKYKDLENNFFDIQMENIRLKNELERLNKTKR